MCEYKILFGESYDKLETMEFVRFGKYLNDKVFAKYPDEDINNTLWDFAIENMDYSQLVDEMIPEELRNYYPEELSKIEEYYFGIFPILSYNEVYLYDFMIFSNYFSECFQKRIEKEIKEKNGLQ